MRSWAEEKKMGTEELLLTLPFRESELVIGKYLAAMVLFGITMALTLPVPFTLGFLGRFEAGQLFSEYLGIMLLGSAGLSIGLFISSLSKNQISAYIVSFAVLLLIMLLGYLNTVYNFPMWISKLVRYIALNSHFESFKKGLLDSRDFMYFVVISAVFLYLNMKVLVFKKWK
jgi:ABC-2 type transport system permease protein